MKHPEPRVLAAARTMSGLDVRGLAAAAGVHYSLLSRAENHKGNPLGSASLRRVLIALWEEGILIDKTTVRRVRSRDDFERIYGEQNDQ